MVRDLASHTLYNNNFTYNKSLEQTPEVQQGQMQFTLLQSCHHLWLCGHLSASLYFYLQLLIVDMSAVICECNTTDTRNPHHLWVHTDSHTNLSFHPFLMLVRTAVQEFPVGMWETPHSRWVNQSIDFYCVSVFVPVGWERSSFFSSCLRPLVTMTLSVPLSVSHLVPEDR